MGVQVKPVAETVSKTNTAASDGIALPFRPPARAKMIFHNYCQPPHRSQG